MLPTVTWLGQAGLLFDFDGFSVMIDPYFSDSVRAINPKNYRRQPIDARFLEIKPDVLIFTHNHLDHFDPETVERILDTDKSITVLAPSSVWGTVRQYGGEHNYVLFDRHTEWTQGDVCFCAVKAAHSDDSAIGVVLKTPDNCYYVTGDTLYNSEIFADLPETIDVIFLPINGVGNNMNMQDAARFATCAGAEQVMPLHFGMFDDLSPDAFSCENVVIPVIYKEMML